MRFALDYATDTTNQRVWNLPNRHPVFCALAEHPAALALVKGTLGWPALLSNISANITGPGGGEMVLHADQLYMPQPWSGVQGINVLWCLDDFTDENGATRFVPGSHEHNRAPMADDQGADTVADRGACGLDGRDGGSGLAQDRQQPHRRRAPGGRVRLVHDPDLPTAGELVPRARR